MQRFLFTLLVALGFRRRLPLMAGGAPFTGESGEAPMVKTYRHRHAIDAAAGTDFDESLFVADLPGNITGVRFIPDAAVSGAATVTSTLLIINKTGPKTAASLAFGSGVDLVAFTAKPITVSGTAANVAVALGDVISFAKTHLSTGTQLAAGLIEVDITRGDIL